MAEKSMLWAAPAGSGDGTAAYTEDETTRLFRRLGKAAANQGVLLDPLPEFGSGSNKELLVAGTASPVNVYAGDAIVQGLYYWNTATVTVPITTPSGATRIDRVVLRASYSADTVRITRIPGTEGAGTPPAMTQTPGTTYDIPLAQCSITTGGVITVTDEREFCHTNMKVATGSLDDLAVTTAKIAADAVTPDKILNRTRKVIVPPLEWPQETGAGVVPYGSPLADGIIRDSNSVWIVPNDFVSGLTVKVIYYATASGNAYLNRYIYYGASGEAYNTHSSNNLADVVTITANQNQLGASNSLASAAIGDIVTFHIEREGSQGTDTLAASLYIRGWLVEYTADS